MKTTAIITTFLTLVFSAPIQPRQDATNLQTFTGALGGITPTPVTSSGDIKRPFAVKGDTFVNIAAAFQRSCDQQFNACANKANGGDKTLSVSACSDQQTQCNAAAQGASATGSSNATAAATQASTAVTTSSVAKACAVKRAVQVV